MRQATSPSDEGEMIMGFQLCDWAFYKGAAAMAGDVETVQDGMGNSWQLDAWTLVVPVGYKSKTAASVGKPPLAIGPEVLWRDAVPGQGYMLPDVLDGAQKSYRRGFVKGGIAGGVGAFIARKL